MLGVCSYDEGAGVAVTPHGFLPRDSHEISPTIGGVHKLMILLRDLVKEQMQQIFGEEMGGSGGPRPPYQKPSNTALGSQDPRIIES